MTAPSGPFILGVHPGHNASACIGDASGVLYAVQEERLCGEKNYWGFPERAVRSCLERVGAAPADLAAVALGSQRVLVRYHSREDVLHSYGRQLSFVGGVRQKLGIPLAVALWETYGRDEVRRRLEGCGLGEVELRAYDHHRAHAATAYYGLRSDPDSPHLVLTCDGAGDRLSASVRVWGGGEERLLATTRDVDSLGAIYSTTTYAMGFMPMEHEYKLMGMAPYASPSHGRAAAEIFSRYLGLDESGLGFRRKTAVPSYAILRRILRDIRGQRFDSLSAGLQLFTEDLLCRWAGNAVRAARLGRVLAAGGVFMNVKANQRIAALDEVESFEAFPSCGDESLCLGAFYLESARRFGDESVGPLGHYYLGDDLDPEETKAAVEAAGFPSERPADMAAAVAEILAAGKPVARCSGRMEFGARALCNRSILADPANQDVVRVINHMVKKRDFWMPFAPVVPAGRQHEVLRNEKGLRSPYMMMTFDTRENFRELIAAVHNSDLSCRPQILEPGQNPGMEAVLEAFAERTGRGVLLNTSFNLHGFPIVRTAAEALHVFANSGLEHLQVGDCLVSKHGAGEKP